MVGSVNNGYQSKLDQAMADTMRAWWEGLSKEELLTYMAEQPQIDANFIRQMLSNANCIMGIGVKFSMTSKEALSDFHSDRG